MGLAEANATVANNNSASRIIEFMIIIVMSFNDYIVLLFCVGERQAG